MHTGEIAPKHWRKFCQKLDETHRGALVRIQLVQPDGVARPLAGELPLQTFALDDQTDACNDAIVIEAGLPNERPFQHRVIEPIRLVLRNGADNDRYNQLHILAENGTTVLFFRPGINTDWLNNLDRESP